MFEKHLLSKGMKSCQNSSVRMVSKLGHYQIIWYLFAVFKTIILSCVLFPPYDSWNICFLQKYGSWKLQPESWNANCKLLSRTLNFNDFCLLILSWRGSIKSSPVIICIYTSFVLQPNTSLAVLFVAISLGGTRFQLMMQCKMF